MVPRAEVALSGRLAVLFPWAVALWIALAGATFAVLLRISAPYGRHARGGFGPRIPAWAGWVAMEAPSPVLVMLFWVGSPARGDPVAIVLLALWLAHYVYRTLVFPFLGRGKKGPMPLSIAASAFAFNLVNGTIQGWGLFHLGGRRDPSWLLDPRFVGGFVLFVAGFAIHARADAVLRGLRAPGETAYRIPRGFLFERVSCPNYLGEIVEWSGWALLTWSLPGLSFAIWTVANLAPRALTHHRWYRDRFPDYPRGRRALVPGLL